LINISASPIAPQVIRPEQWDLAATAHVREASDALYAAVRAYQKHSASAFKRRAAAHGLLPVVEPRTMIYEGDPWLFSLSRNKHRRHMSQDQIAIVVAELMTMKPLRANQHEGGPIGLPSIAKAAENAGITETALKSAKVLYKHGTPEEVRAVKSGNAPLYKKADDVRKRRRALTPPAPPKPKSVQAQPAADPIDDVACDIIGKASDGVWRPLPKIASIVDVAASAAREGLERLGPDCVETRRGADGLEYRIKPSESEDSRDADLKSQLAAKNAEIANLKSRLVEKDAEIDRLKALLAATTASKKSAPPRPKKIEPSISKH
jgi:hypothetical protein